MKTEKDITPTLLFERIAAILDQARNHIVRTVNSEVVFAYWYIGKEIFEVLQAGKKRSSYGTKLLDDLAEKLLKRYGKGFSTTNLKYFKTFYLSYPERLSNIRHPVGDESGKGPKGRPVGDELVETGKGFHPNLSWSHYRALMRVENPAARQFYEEETVAGGWSKRQLERQIHSLFYERILASRDKKGMLTDARKQDDTTLTPIDVLKDPYVLEFLNLPEVDSLHESVLESAIINNLQHFLLELGRGFSFVARKKKEHVDIATEFIRKWPLCQPVPQ